MNIKRNLVGISIVLSIIVVVGLIVMMAQSIHRTNESLRQAQNRLALAYFSDLLHTTDIQIVGRTGGDDLIIKRPYTIHYELGVDEKIINGSCLFADDGSVCILDP